MYKHFFFHVNSTCLSGLKPRRKCQKSLLRTQQSQKCEFLKQAAVPTFWNFRHVDCLSFIRRQKEAPFFLAAADLFQSPLLRSFKVHLRFYRIRRLHIPRLDCIMSIYLSVFIKNFVRQWLQKVKKKRHSTKKVLILSQVETLTSLSVC